MDALRHFDFGSDANQSPTLTVARHVAAIAAAVLEPEIVLGAAMVAAISLMLRTVQADRRSAAKRRPGNT